MQSTSSYGFFEREMQTAKAKARHEQAGVALPRLCLAGLTPDSQTHLVHLALLTCLKATGASLQAFHRVGDEAAVSSYITGRSPRLLDSWLYDEATLTYLFHKQAEGRRLSTLEASPSLWSGLWPSEQACLDETNHDASCFDLVCALDFPVVLVAKVSDFRQGLVPLLEGTIQAFEQKRATWEAQQGRRSHAKLAGLILTELRSNEATELVDYVETQVHLPVLAVFPPLQSLSDLPVTALGDRQTTAWKKLDPYLQHLMQVGQECLDLERLLHLADQASPLAHRSPSGLLSLQKRAQGFAPLRLGLAYDRAFFDYNQDDLELLRDFGFELVPFSPLEETMPTQLDALYFGGRYCPERLPLLSQKQGLRQRLQALQQQGMPILADGQGAIYLSQGFLDVDGMTLPMMGLFGAKSRAPLAIEERQSKQVRLAEWSEEVELSATSLSPWRQYARLQVRSSSIYLNEKESYRCFGAVELLPAEGASNAVLLSAKGQVGAVVTANHLLAMGSHLSLYAAPAFALRLMEQAARYRDERQARLGVLTE